RAFEDHPRCTMCVRGLAIHPKPAVAGCLLNSSRPLPTTGGGLLHLGHEAEPQFHQPSPPVVTFNLGGSSSLGRDSPSVSASVSASVSVSVSVSGLASASIRLHPLATSRKPHSISG